MNYMNYGDATLQDQDTAGAYGSTKMNADSPSKRTFSQAPFTHMTAKMIANAQLDEATNRYSFNGKEVSYVEFMGVIQSVKQNKSSTSYDVFDGSGIVTVIQFTNPNFETGVEQPNETVDYYPEGSFIDVCGQIRYQQNSQQTIISAFSVSPLQDVNKYYHHFLRIIQANLHAQKKDTAFSTNNPYNNIYNDVKSSPYGTYNDVNQYNTNPYGTVNDNNMEEIDNMILDVFDEYKRSGVEDVNVDMIFQKLQVNGIQENEIRESIGKLENMTKIYLSGNGCYRLI